LTTENNANEPLNVLTTVVNAQVTSYMFNVTPNTRYEVIVGTEASEPCVSRLPTSWSETVRVGCTTPPSSEKLLILDSIKHMASNKIVANALLQNILNICLNQTS